MFYVYVIETIFAHFGKMLEKLLERFFAKSKKNVNKSEQMSDFRENENFKKSFATFEPLIDSNFIQKLEKNR